jgi:hypothetical protein
LRKAKHNDDTVVRLTGTAIFTAQKPHMLSAIVSLSGLATETTTVHDVWQSLRALGYRPAHAWTRTAQPDCRYAYPPAFTRQRLVACIRVDSCASTCTFGSVAVVGNGA